MPLKRLKIALVAPPWFAVPPTGYGGVELVVSLLADGLADRGHDVTLFASGGSKTRARLVCTYAEPPSRLLGDPVVEAAHLVQAYSHSDQFDIIHDHTMLGLIAGSLITTPVVHTLHGQVTDQAVPFYEAVGGSVHLVCISHHQRSTLPAGLDAAVIHNGICASDYPFSATPGDYLLFVGRMCAEKGILSAIEIARRTSLRLVIVAKINEPPEMAYFEDHVRPALEGIESTLLLQPPQEVKAAAYRDALATLFPVDWPEPFGLVMAESMAAGTPVVAFRRGSVPEVVLDGVTGYVCDGLDGAVAAVKRVPLLDRRACRDRVERLFEASRCVASHEQLYLDILAQGAHHRVEGTLVAAAGGD